MPTAVPEFDKAAFREGLINAFCHRDYPMLGTVRVLIDEDGIITKQDVADLLMITPDQAYSEIKKLVADGKLYKYCGGKYTKYKIVQRQASQTFSGKKFLNKNFKNILTVNLQKQMEELKGAMKLSQKMKEDTVQIVSMDVNIYWNTIEEEEKQGNQFIDIAKDIVEIEKGYYNK